MRTFRATGALNALEIRVITSEPAVTTVPTPRATPAAEEESQSVRRGPKCGIAMSKDLHILFVEDQPNDAELCQHELRQAGFTFTAERVCTRASYERALAESRPDLILSDFSMPTDLDGFLALQIARERAVDVPFVFVSGTIGEERAVAAMKAGATDYVLKDNLDRLGPVVKRALDEAHQRRSVLHAQDALRTSEATFRSFMEHLPGRASIRDLDGRYTYVNHAWEEASGFKAEEVIGRTFREVSDIKPAGELASAHRQVVATNAPIKRLLKNESGERAQWWLSHDFPVPAPDGSPAMVGTIALDVSEQKMQEEKLAYLAWHDPVTGLANRALLRERLGAALQAAKREARAVAVLVWDVKRFHTINDSYGRDIGDGLLSELARRIEAHSARFASVARLSADYFAAYMTDAGDASQVARMLESAAGVLAEPFVIGGNEIAVGVSFGVAVYPHDGTDADALLSNAEAAAKQAKSRGEPYLFYETEMNARVAEKLSLESRLRRALDKDQFVLHYQPKIKLASARRGARSADTLERPRKRPDAAGAFHLAARGDGTHTGRWAMGPL